MHAILSVTLIITFCTCVTMYTVLWSGRVRYGADMFVMVKTRHDAGDSLIINDTHKTALEI